MVFDISKTENSTHPIGYQTDPKRIRDFVINILKNLEHYFWAVAQQVNYVWYVIIS